MGKTDVIDYAEICDHAKRKRECTACAEIAALREENERLRNELYKSNLAIINDVIPPSDGDDPLDIGIIIWHKWPGEKPVNDDPIIRIAQSDEGKIYLTKTPPSKWCKGNSFHWAEIATRQFRRTDKPGESQGD